MSEKIMPRLWFDGRAEEAMRFYAPVFGRMLTDRDAARVARVMRAMLKMVKLDLAALTRAYEES